MSDSNYQLLETPKFSLKSPRARPKEHLQQELIRASDRKSRPKKQAVKRCLSEGLSRHNGQLVSEARKYLPQYDQLVQAAVNLYVTSELKKISLPNSENNEMIKNLIQQFFGQPHSLQQQYVKTAALTQSKGAQLCSDPFLIFLDLHKRQSRSRRRTERRLEGSDSDIGLFACNAYRAESGEESDPTRFRAGGNQDDIVLSEARALWKRMSPELKLPFFVNAFLAVHAPEALDQAL
ncbi:uncharacterized protein LOC128740543 [Sabethes cyaneus]|uniref:uncharacterized protein LOC128740543 n=1 Tax=Sabethes cyaneus TaxID=53552 RepID=UPI00237D7E2B|nr:uncharacterized protein LOC128740543 [Sabethes cyaneus]